ncbi:sorbosone dehydrogenase [Panacibacter ginsenosidivorans]|uniref:Sorbosone dehydrogenase n=1 Tax=Panacibacter ginsenosidivorans TaxID=1813871 RepID=A0A5B8VFT5_9BACT|nr:PQQ-dependent sugar dehydrogenase [Panacibacter ginsenosidivorans]QEC69931.1 sorbosone dehydrogenase [Panacibacter ginsenosidivorans]
MKKTLLFSLLVASGIGITLPSCANYNKDSTSKSPADEAVIKLPAGFSITEVATGLKEPRHIAVDSKGDLFVKLGTLMDGKGIVLYQNNNGKLEKKNSFGNYAGTGITIKDDYLYASSNTEVYRYKLDAAATGNVNAQPEKIITGLIDRNQHNSKSITLDNEGNIYVNIGAYSNSCQEKDRSKGSMGRQPCPILDSAGGIWQFKADKANQTYGDGVRYATGLRNVVGLDWNNATNSLFVMQHGRDGLHDLFPDMYDTKQSAELPAECMYQINKGDNAGWPYIYYDQIQHRKILAPEYGGDGKKDGPAGIIDPTVAFPGHMAPNGLLFYTGNMFPEKYKNGAFVAFHGSWNRAPEPQKGYFVAFVPFKDGKPSGDWEIFADNFAGGPEFVSPGKAKHRPCGLAQGPDGALYVSDDQGGVIYKITYKK